MSSNKVLSFAMCKLIRKILAGNECKYPYVVLKTV